MPETVAPPLARSPIPVAGPSAVVDGWLVSARRSDAALRLCDLSPLTKVLVRARQDGAVPAALGVGFGRAARDATGALVVGSGPGEWTVLDRPGRAADLLARFADLSDDRLVSATDITHGRALLRLTGNDAARLLSKLCAIDLHEAVTPDGSALRTSVATLATDLVRDDRSGLPSYLLHCERSSGRYLHEALLDAGAEFGADEDGFPTEGRDDDVPQ